MADEQEKQEKKPKAPKGAGKRPKGGGEKPEAPAQSPEPPAEPAPRARLWDFYEQQVRAKLQQQFGFKNLHQIPRLKEIVLNVGMGDASKNPKGLDAAGGLVAAPTRHDPGVRPAEEGVAS